MTTAVDISPAAVERMVERMEAEMVEYRLCDDLKPMLRALRSTLTAEQHMRAGLNNACGQWKEAFDEKDAALQHARAALTASGEALREYGHHKNSCRFISNVPNPGIRPGSCTCGLEAAMEKANG